MGFFCEKIFINDVEISGCFGRFLIFDVPKLNLSRGFAGN